MNRGENKAKNRYVALFRAINVGGNAIIKMADLKKRVESLGLSDVSTYIQTGNVLFSSGEAGIAALESLLEKGIRDKFKYDVKVFVLSLAQLKKAADNNPFDAQRLAEDQLCHLMFLAEKPSADRVKALMALQGKEYRFKVQDKVFYFAYNKADAGPKRRNLNFEKLLGVTGTARSFKVVDKLIELLGT
jgi:uncharacterized protein (DUF1697 family)